MGVISHRSTNAMPLSQCMTWFLSANHHHHIQQMTMAPTTTDTQQPPMNTNGDQ